MSAIKTAFISSMFLLVVTAGGVWPLALGGVIFYLINFSLLLFIFFNNNKIDVDLGLKSGVLLIVSFAILIAFQLINVHSIFDDEFPKFLFRVFIAIFTLFLYKNWGRNIVKDLYFVLILISIHAAINFLAGFFLVDRLTDFEVDDMIKIKTFYHLFFYESKVELGAFTVLRNQGFFWEPGVLSVFLNLLLYLCLFEYKRKAESLVVIFLILTTFSTTGLILIFIQLLFLVKNWIKKNFILIIPGIGAILLFIPILVINFGQKFSNENDSYLLRVYDYTVAFQILSKNVLTGIGFGNKIYLNAQYSYSIYQDSFLTEPRGNSNSIVSLFVSFGIIIGIYTLFKLYRQSIFNSQNLFFLIVVICLLSEPLIFTSFFMIIAFSGFFKNESPLTI